MSTLIRKLAWSRLSNPKVAVSLSAAGLLLGMLLGATAPNAETLPVLLPLSRLLPSLGSQHVLASLMLYTSISLACLGLAGMLWAHSQGWRPNPRVLLLISTGIVAIMVCLTPVGSSDTASYAAYGRIAALGGNPYTSNPLAFLGAHSPYTMVVGTMWKAQPSVYGPFATTHPVVRGLDRPRERRHHHLGPDDPQRDRLPRRGPAAPADLGRPGAGHAVLDRQPGPHPGTGQRRSPRHAGGGRGDRRHPGRPPVHRDLGRRRGRGADRAGLRGEDLRGADRPGPGLRRCCATATGSASPG